MQNTSTSTEIPLFSCPLPTCSKKFDKYPAFKKHLFTHTGGQPHACSICGKRFNRNDNRIRHEKTTHRPPSTDDVKLPSAVAPNTSTGISTAPTFQPLLLNFLLQLQFLRMLQQGQTMIKLEPSISPPNSDVSQS